MSVDDKWLVKHIHRARKCGLLDRDHAAKALELAKNRPFNAELILQLEDLYVPFDAATKVRSSEESSTEPANEHQSPLAIQGSLKLGLVHLGLITNLWALFYFVDSDTLNGFIAIPLVMYWLGVFCFRSHRPIRRLAPYLTILVIATLSYHVMNHFAPDSALSGPSLVAYILPMVFIGYILLSEEIYAVAGSYYQNGQLQTADPAYPNLLSRWLRWRRKHRKPYQGEKATVRPRRHARRAVTQGLERLYPRLLAMLHEIANYAIAPPENEWAPPTTVEFRFFDSGPIASPPFTTLYSGGGLPEIEPGSEAERWLADTRIVPAALESSLQGSEDHLEKQFLKWIKCAWQDADGTKSEITAMAYFVNDGTYYNLNQRTWERS